MRRKFKLNLFFVAVIREPREVLGKKSFKINVQTQIRLLAIFSLSLSARIRIIKRNQLALSISFAAYNLGL